MKAKSINYFTKVLRNYLIFGRVEKRAQAMFRAQARLDV